MRVALSHAAQRACRRAAAASLDQRAEQGHAHAHGRLVPVSSVARASHGGRRGRLPRRGLLRLLRRGRLRAPPARRRLAQPVRACGRGGAPRAALHRSARRAAHRGNGTQPRPVHAQAPLARSRRRGALADRLGLRPARARRAASARALAASLLATRARDAQARPRPGPARGRRGAQLTAGEDGASRRAWRRRWAAREASSGRAARPARSRARLLARLRARRPVRAARAPTPPPRASAPERARVPRRNG